MSSGPSTLTFSDSGHHYISRRCVSYHRTICRTASCMNLLYGPLFLETLLSLGKFYAISHETIMGGDEDETTDRQTREAIKSNFLPHLLGTYGAGVMAFIQDTSVRTLSIGCSCTACVKSFSSTSGCASAWWSAS